jgi:F-type H+-transporting ATPase subunit b
MSTTLIVNLAFLVGFILSYKLLKKVIKNVLKNKRNKIKFSSEEAEKLKNDMLDYYKKSSQKYRELSSEVNKMVEETLDKANNIIEHNRHNLCKTLDDNARSNLKKVTDQFEKTIEALKASTPDMAADAVRKIIYECKDEKRSSEVVSSLSRDLSKKLH